MGHYSLAQTLFTISVVAIPMIVAITLHEAAHGWVASKLGDPTAKMLGRVSFNPLRHVDPFGTIALPLIMLFTTHILFGWAKPVPVNFSRLHHPRRDMVLVAAAGPATNLLLALLSGYLMYVALVIPGTAGEWAFANLQYSIVINVLLAVFNMIPLPPLDGGRVAVGLLPRPLSIRLAGLERYGLLILLGIIFILPLFHINVLGWLLSGPVAFFTGPIQSLTGIELRNL